MIQIKHQNPDKGSPFTRCTFAVQVPTKEALLLFLSQSDVKIGTVSIGVAWVHTKDNYNKKIGRDLATQDVCGRQMILTNIELRGKRVVYHFVGLVNKNGKVKKVELGFSHVPEAVQARLEYIFTE